LQAGHWTPPFTTTVRIVLANGASRITMVSTVEDALVVGEGSASSFLAAALQRLQLIG
jgi:phosphosulfolactate phosphohydrolase-like enzyme